MPLFSEGMKPVKVWSSDRKLKKFFVAKDFTDLLTRGM